jgi:maltose alpha-D-glucosyltransferase/alpha-amylase
MNDPLWYKDAVIYEAHVKSFYDSNNDGIGDFNGLTQKLDYLHGLGVTCVWLLPFFPSPLRDDGYDVADYRNIHPSYGTLDDFTAFVAAAHARGIRVLIELVVNHTSDQHPWFQRARQAPPESPERDFYIWSDTDQKFPETRIIFSDTEKSNWTWDPVAGQYYWHRFFSHQPDLNHNNPAVVDAVLDVLRFWLDLGVDALRLEAVAYLCVREGTSNENLRETHAVLKRMRQVVDGYGDRMLLAEANQWPSDVRPYFGEGDECHMAFHFPLMPRMFMALRQEDRHAITEILNQTPELPETAQWALFLRNHDELTVEMITDEERDYMYSVYANDPQMRINGGIRRRLAPLVENSRRRVELLNALLFSLPGTPVVYYGDEIGMGDNIYLGDRNGVRTPMQWSGDRNAGFSRADPARLFAPPIQDPVYGYQAINVEAQERYPFSLLNWMKRMIALRRQHTVFGRGSLDVVPCANRKILAYVRRDERETILIVVNLSRDVQPAALDLAAFAGLLPVEMHGLSEFPRIGSEPYFLTLSAYASYFFTLQQESMAMTPRAAAPADLDAAIVETLPGLLMGVDWNNMLDGGTRGVLERHALVPFLRRQRWMVPAAREIRQARFVDWAPLRAGDRPVFLTIVNVEDLDGSSESFVLPLALLDGDAAAAALKQTPSCVLAKVTGARKGAIVDGLSDAATRDLLCDAIESGRTLISKHGSVRGVPVPGPVHLPDARLKLLRRIEPSPNPEWEIGRFLTSRGFSRTPPLAGALEYVRRDLEPGTLAVLQARIKHQGTAWDYAIEDLRRYYERVSARVKRSDGQEGRDELDRQEAREGHEGPPPFFAALEQWQLTSATLLGKRTAELHAALTGEPGSPFAPEPIDAAALDALAHRMRAQVAASLDLLADRRASLDAIERQQAERVLDGRDLLIARIDRIRALEDGGSRIRIHGDYHLGQVLRVEEDFVILDFDGDPAQTIAERRDKQSPLKDVGSMIRSFGYAAYATLFAFGLHAPDDYAMLEPWTATWERWLIDAFLTGYLASAADSPMLPASAPARDALLSAFTVDKALRELWDELHNRPDWVRVPLAGVTKLIRSDW